MVIVVTKTAATRHRAVGRGGTVTSTIGNREKSKASLDSYGFDHELSYPGMVWDHTRRRSLLYQQPLRQLHMYVVKRHWCYIILLIII